MSKFGAYLRELLEERNLSISELSRISGVERTSLQKSITGNRMLPHDAVEKLIWSLQLTPEESEKLRYCYDIFFIGEDKYKSRKIIRRTLENLEYIDSMFSAGCYDVPDYSPGYAAERMWKEKILITGKHNAKYLIRAVFERELAQENPEIELTMPADMKFFNGFLFHLFQKKPFRFKITQIISIHRNKMEKSLNLNSLECFVDLLPVCLVSNRQYEPYYYFDTSVAALYTDPFPYFVVTRDCVLGISSDGEKVLLLNSTEAVGFYRRHFQTLKKQCHALVNYSEGLISLLGEYYRVYDSRNMYVCMSQPSFICEWDDEEIRKKIRKDFPGWEEVTEACVSWISSLRKVDMYHSFFKAEGVIRFMEEGRIDDFPEIVEEITIRERLELLERLISSVESEKRITARMFNEKVFTYPSFVSLVTSPETGVGIFTTSRYGNNSFPISVHVHEADVEEAFRDFLDNLPASEITCSKEDTLKFLKDTWTLYAGKL